MPHVRPFKRSCLLILHRHRLVVRTPDSRPRAQLPRTGYLLIPDTPSNGKNSARPVSLRHARPRCPPVRLRIPAAHAAIDGRYSAPVPKLLEPDSAGHSARKNYRIAYDTIQVNGNGRNMAFTELNTRIRADANARVMTVPARSGTLAQNPQRVLNVLQFSDPRNATMGSTLVARLVVCSCNHRGQKNTTHTPAKGAYRTLGQILQIRCQSANAIPTITLFTTIRKAAPRAIRNPSSRERSANCAMTERHMRVASTRAKAKNPPSDMWDKPALSSSAKSNDLRHGAKIGKRAWGSSSVQRLESRP